MTDKENMICSNISYEGLKTLDSKDISEIIELATSIEGNDKLGNVLFAAITKAYSLGYYRASEKEAE